MPRRQRDEEEEEEEDQESGVSLDKSIALYATLFFFFFFKKSPLLTSWIESWPFLGICVRNKEGN